MFKGKLVLTFYGLTPIHMGSGTSVSCVDNPIQREKHTDFPLISSGGIKGVIRELASRKWNKEEVNIIFGPEEGGEEYASCISFTDAKILLYPVRSVRGVFAYVTCPYVLNRFKKELSGLKLDKFPEINLNLSDDKIIVCSNSELEIDKNHVAFEEFVFEIDSPQKIDNTGLVEALSGFLPSEINADFFKNHFAIISDNVFRDFVKYAVEVRTRIRISQETGTVEGGALFTIELIPAESVFYGFLFINEPYKENEKIKSAEDVTSKMKELLNGEKEKENNILQFGGDETIGMGLVKIKMYEHPNNGEQK